MEEIMDFVTAISAAEPTVLITLVTLCSLATVSFCVYCFVWLVKKEKD